jgi:hypothetical protein
MSSNCRRMSEFTCRQCIVIWLEVNSLESHSSNVTRSLGNCHGNTDKVHEGRRVEGWKLHYSTSFYPELCRGWLLPRHEWSSGSNEWPLGRPPSPSSSTTRHELLTRPPPPESRWRLLWKFSLVPTLLIGPGILGTRSTSRHWSTSMSPVTNVNKIHTTSNQQGSSRNIMYKRWIGLSA